MKIPAPYPDNSVQRLIRAEPAVARSYAGAGRLFHIEVMVERGRATDPKSNR